MEKIQAIPRWLRGGFVSVIAVLTIYELSIFELSSYSFGGTIATIAIIFEFSLGALLGWKVKNIWWGIALWIAANILARAAVFLFALYVVENYF